LHRLVESLFEWVWKLKNHFVKYARSERMFLKVARWENE
jgi:hypothetical protein